MQEDNNKYVQASTSYEKKHQIVFSIQPGNKQCVLLLSKQVEELVSYTTAEVLREQEFWFSSSLVGARAGSRHCCGETPSLDTRTGI